jgi:hydrogenase nickel incorporation protein HypA/HybF
MHEMDIAQSILDITLDNAAQHSAKQVTKIQLLIGKMTGVEPDALHFCFDVLAAGSIAAQATLEIVLVPLVVSCRDCGNQFTVERYRFHCEACGSAQLDILSGRELRVEHLEVD